MALAPAGGQKPAPQSPGSHLNGGRPSGRSAPNTSPAQGGRHVAPVKGNGKTPR